MRKQVGLALVLVLSLAGTVSARALPRVTGGGDCQVGSTVFSLAVNVIEDPQGELKGKIQYTREDLEFHADVMCSAVSEDGTVAVAAGPARIQTGSYNPWAGVAIQEGGTGSGDLVRVPGFDTEGAALAYCEEANETFFPAEVIDGDFTIRDW